MPTTATEPVPATDPVTARRRRRPHVDPSGPALVDLERDDTSRRHGHGTGAASRRDAQATGTATAPVASAASANTGTATARARAQPARRPLASPTTPAPSATDGPARDYSLTPSGSRPSSASLPRWARSVSAAAPRNAPGTSDHAASSSSSSVRRPSSSAAISRASRSRRWARYASRWAAGSVDLGPVPRVQALEVARAQALERGHVAAQRARIGRDEHAAGAEHRVAGEAHALHDERQVVGRVAGRRDDFERADAVAAGDRLRARDLARIRGHTAERVDDGGDRLGVVVVIVGDDDPLGASALLCCGDDRGDVRVERRTRIDDPARVTADDPRVGAGQGHQPGLSARTSATSTAHSFSLAALPSDRHADQHADARRDVADARVEDLGDNAAEREADAHRARPRPTR